MAITYTDNGGGAPNGSDLEFTFTFPVIQTEDVKVSLNGVTQATTKYAVDTASNPTKITFNNTSVDSSVQESSGAPKSGVRVNVYRETTVGKASGDDDPKAVFASGSSIRATDLNANSEQALYAIHELQDRPIESEDIQADAITNAKIADDQIDSEHYVDGSIDSQHIGDNQVTMPKLGSGALPTDITVADANIVTGTLDNRYYTETELNAGQLDNRYYTETELDAGQLDNRYFTETELTNGSLDGRYFTETELTNGALDGRYFTETESDARYFNISSGETIKDGDTFPDNDTTIATTAAINDRIIDLVDDVGGFVPIANETSFPNANPDVNNGTGTIVSISTLASNHTSSGSGVITISNGTVGNSTVTINGAENSTTYSAGYGLLVETTTTLNTYTFHRLVPKATEVTTVAGKATEIGLLGTAAVVEDLSILGTADVVNDLAILGTNDVVADLNTLGTADVVADLNTLGTADVVNDMNILGTSANVTAMSNCSGSISSINNASSNLNSINNFGDQYQVAANNPSTDGGGNALAAGDLYFNTSANELKVYNGSAWQGGVTATGNFAVTTGNTFTGDNRNNDGVKALFGTGSDLEVYHNGTNSHIDHVGTGDFFIRTVGSGDKDLFLRANNDVFIKPQLNENGISVIGNGDVVLYYDSSEKFKTTSTGAYVNGSLGIGTTSPLDKIEVQNGAVLVGHTTNATAVRTLLQGYGFKIGSNLYGNVSIRSSYNHNSNSGSLDFYTASGGLNTTKRLEITSDGNVQIPADDKKLQLGASQDLEIYHNGSHSYISDSGTGNLRILGDNNVDIMDAGATEYKARFDTNGAVNLYYDNSKKLELTSSGVSVTGSHNVSGGYGVLSSGSAVLQLFSSASSFTCIKDFTDDLRIRSGKTTIMNEAQNETLAKFTANGSVELYHDNTKRYETHAYGSKITAAGAEPHGQNAISRAALNISGQFGGGLVLDDLGNGGVTHYLSGAGAVYNISTTTSGTNPEKAIEINRNGNVELYYDDSKKFETTSTGATVTGHLDFVDGDKIRLGNGDDLQLYHTSNNSFIINSTGTLDVRSAGINFRDEGGNEDYIKCVDNGAVELYHDNTKKFATDSGGVVVYDDIFVLDNNIIYCGDGLDLMLMSDGSTSYIRSDDLRIRSKDNTENHITCAKDGGVKLYYDNVQKFETVSSGCQLPDQAYLWLGSDGDAYNYHNGSNFYLRNNTGNFYFGNTSNYGLVFQTNNISRWQVSNSGHFTPEINNAFDVGSSSYRIRNIYTNDLHLSNEGSSNDMDGTWGDWTIQEGESNLFLKNNRSGKKYKFNLTEVS